MLACKQVDSAAECEALGGSLNEGVCTAASEEEQLEYQVYSRCNGGTLWPWEEIEIVSNLKDSSAQIDPQEAAPGDSVHYTVHVRNTGSGLTMATLSNPTPEGLEPVPNSALATDGEAWPPGSDPFDNLIYWRGCVPPGGETSVSYKVRVGEDVPKGETIINRAILSDVLTGEAIAIRSTITVMAKEQPPPESYTWRFTIKPTGISIITIPIPEDIDVELRDLEVKRLVKVSGELYGMELDETSWILSGMVMSPGFLPFLSAVSSTAIFAGQDAEGLTRATLAVIVTVAKSEATVRIPFAPKPDEKDSDGDTVPDEEDLCPDVPGEPGNDGCPIYEEHPDADADGTPDIQDACPHEPGPPENNGCPSEEWEDTDGDGIPDWQDWCPEVYGDDSHGCPEH